MSFADIERNLRTPPVSPSDHYGNIDKDTIFTSTSSATTSSKMKVHHSSVLPPIKLPSGFPIVASGSSRDSIGLNFASPQQLPVKSPHTQPLHPPPVSPKRKSNNLMTQHSRFLEDNTRFDTPRPNLTSSAAIAARSDSNNSSVRTPTATTAITRSPHTVATSITRPNNRILKDHRPSDMDRRQMLSPPTSPIQASLLTTANSLNNNQYQGFTKVDNLEPANLRTTQKTSINENSNSTDNNTNNASDTIINIESFPSSSSSILPSANPTTITTTKTPKPATSSTSSSLSYYYPIPTLASIESQDYDYDMLVRHVSQQIFNISSNIAVLERLVPCIGQRHKDTIEMRSSLHAGLDSTQELVKSAHSQIKILARYHQPPMAGPPSTVGIRVQPTVAPSELSSWQRKVLASRRQTHQRLTKDLSLASRSFQELQKQAVEAERHQVTTLRRLSGSASYRRLSQRRSDLMDLSQEEIEAGALLDKSLSSTRHGISSSSSDSARISHNVASGYGSIGVTPYTIHDRELSLQEEALLREILAIDGELVFQESILQEREIEIRKIEESMGEVMDVMRELGTLVHEQRSDVDYLHDNILQTRGRIQLAQQEVLKASEYQRQSREKLCYLIMIVSVVGALVMLAFVST
ncbi:hypothetical protein BX616_008112 [Lobosporangium transversale]|uniref:t-SNARE n=1 Tax=Lobosporangium transversale TaxID=64571 RepID=A0A1Y2GRF7_9FUNG|nr:t-SNARE [Lobosporangium transversale]KAF9918532.1 hypothetical protein BX616_008112 [Lobosporangium transversale]ORZ20062.1 t-SNARE [Lobosporangium transversale]|eukprot:XP_021882602.1 t-SNARE [Lobosporangium transversale]